MRLFQYKIQASKYTIKIVCYLIIFYFLAAGLFIINAKTVNAATLYAGSAYEQISEGQTFAIDWFLNTEGQTINTVDLEINYSPDTLKPISATQGNSTFALWIQNPTIDEASHSIRLTAGAPNGLRADKIPVFRSTWQAIKAGNAQITLAENSKALQNNDQGTPAILRFSPSKFTIAAKNTTSIVASPSHPDQNAWYKDHVVDIEFTPQPNQSYSYSFSSNPEVIPEDKEMKANGRLSYQNMPDGVYYFKLRSKVGPSTWKELEVFRVQIDSTPPEPFTPSIDSESSVSDGKSFLSFSTVDNISGIGYYIVSTGPFHEDIKAVSPYHLVRPLIGDTVTVTAVDAAGNSRIETIAYAGYISKNAGITLLVIFLMFLTVLIIYKKKILKLNKK